MDMRVLMFGLALSIVTGLVCGLSPALSARRTDLVAALNVEGRGFTGGRLAGRKLLVTAQIALSFVLLAGAGLFARTLANLRDIDFGFDDSHLLMLRVDPTLSKYDTPRLFAFYDRAGGAPRMRCRASRDRRSRWCRCSATGAGAAASLLDTGEQDNQSRSRSQCRPLRLLRRGGHPARCRTRLHQRRHRGGSEGRRRERGVRAPLFRRTTARGPRPAHRRRRPQTHRRLHHRRRRARRRRSPLCGTSAEPFWWAPYQQLGSLARDRHGAARAARRVLADRADGRKS